MKAYNCTFNWRLAIVTAIFLGGPMPAWADTDIYVDGNPGITTRNGEGWSTAYEFLQDALDEIDDEVLSDVVIHIADGTFYPDDDDDVPSSMHTEDDRNEVFLVVDTVTIEGGYAGYGAPDPDARDPSVYVTILSGDIGTASVATDNGFTVLRVDASATVDTIVDGVTIRDGYGGTPIFQVGGAGILLEFGASPRFQDCIIRNNVVQSGVAGGLYAPSGNVCRIVGCQFIENQSDDGGAVLGDATNLDTSLTFEDCLFQDNLVEFGVGGGAVTLKQGAQAGIFDSVFYQNEAQDGDDARGGALFVCLGSTCEVRRTRFEENLVNDINGKGGAIYCDGQSAVGVSSVIVLDSAFVNNRVTNRSPKGGAVYLGGVNYSPVVSRLIDCTFRGNSALHEEHVGQGGAVYVNGKSDHEMVNCLFYDNVSQLGGAGFILTGFEPSPPDPPVVPRLINCTITENSADQNGGGLYVSNSASKTYIRNCIVWGNIDGGSVVQEAQIFEAGFMDSDVQYSCIQDAEAGDGTIPFCSPNCAGTNNHNIDVDPLFAHTTSRNFRLSKDSPCIDAANTPVAPEDALDVDDDTVETCIVDDCEVGERTPDLDLLERVLDDADTTDTGVAEADCMHCDEVVDMGAYEFQCLCPSGTLGDLSDDDVFNGLDIQPFVVCLLDGDIEQAGCFCADMNLDGMVDTEDIPCFVTKLLTKGDVTCDEGPCTPAGPTPHGADCNENGIPDPNDIADCDDDPACEDCNGNFSPDGCDLDPTDPDGDGQVSNDLNGNSIPDECEADCNSNGVPDDKDIADQTSNDVNSNGIPDECEADCNSNGVPDDWDISQGTSPDCNANGLPDECEFDCNANGVPDDCDVDPSDPDGDGEVSEDCQPNGLPDECDFELPIMPSLDCNENGIPDECDIASGTSQDCNGNGFPDECDIASEISEDENENGIPDECEQQQAQSGGGGSPAPAAMSAQPSSQAWEAFWEWSAEQAWGPEAEISPAAQFQACVDKLRELGLPLGSPSAVATPAAE